MDNCSHPVMSVYVILSYFSVFNDYMIEGFIYEIIIIVQSITLSAPHIIFLSSPVLFLTTFLPLLIGNLLLWNSFASFLFPLVCKYDFSQFLILALSPISTWHNMLTEVHHTPAVLHMCEMLKEIQVQKKRTGGWAPLSKTQRAYTDSFPFWPFLQLAFVLKYSTPNGMRVRKSLSSSSSSHSSDHWVHF